MLSHICFLYSEFILKIFETVRVKKFFCVCNLQTEQRYCNWDCKREVKSDTPSTREKRRKWPVSETRN